MRDGQGSGGGGPVSKNQPFAAPRIHVGHFDVVLVAGSNFKPCIQNIHEMFAIFDDNRVTDGMKMRRGVNISVKELQEEGGRGRNYKKERVFWLCGA
jgi:hypothetical protein